MLDGDPHFWEPIPEPEPEPESPPVVNAFEQLWEGMYMLAQLLVWSVVVLLSFVPLWARTGLTVLAATATTAMGIVLILTSVAVMTTAFVRIGAPQSAHYAIPLTLR